MGISLSGLTESSTGNLTISAGSGNDILIGNGSTQLFVDGGTDTLGVGGTAVTGSRLNIETGAVALDFITSTGTAFNVVADTVNDTSGSATLAIVPTVQVGVMTYTSSNAMTYTDTASVYIAGIPVASTNVTFTNPAYALWVDSGAVRFDDRTFWIGGIAYEFPANNGNASEFLQTDGSGNLVWSSVASASASTTVTVTDNEATNESNLVTFVAGAATATGNHGLEMDGDFTYSPNTGTVAATNFSGNLTGTLQTAAQGTITSVGTLTSLTTSGDVTVGDDLLLTDGKFVRWGGGSGDTRIYGSAAANLITFVTAGAESFRITGGATPTMTFAGATTVVTSSGNLTLSAATGADVLIGDNATILYVDGGTNGLGLGAAAQANYKVTIGGAHTGGSNSYGFRVEPVVTGVANNNYAIASIKGELVEAGSGTHPHGVGLWLEAPTTTTGGGGTTTAFTTFKIDGPPDGGTGTNYAMWVDDGDSRFDGDITIQTAGDGNRPYYTAYMYSDTAADRPYLSFRRSNNDTEGTLTAMTDGDYVGTINFLGVDSGGNWDAGASIDVVHKGSVGAKIPVDMIFATHSSSAKNTDQLILASTGKVGIGVSAPGSKLQVNVDDGAIATPDASTALTLVNASAVSDSVQLSLISGNEAYGQIWFGDAQDENRGRIFYKQNDDYLGFSTATAESMRIAGGGTATLTLYGASTIANSSGALTLDAVTDINLDADNYGYVAIKDAGTELFTLYGDSSLNYYLRQNIYDKSLFFRVNTGTSGSASWLNAVEIQGTNGAVIFNGSWIAGGTSNGYLRMYGDSGSSNYMQWSDAGVLLFATATTINTAAGDLTIDAAGGEIRIGSSVNVDFQQNGAYNIGGTGNNWVNGGITLATGGALTFSGINGTITTTGTSDLQINAARAIGLRGPVNSRYGVAIGGAGDTAFVSTATSSSETAFVLIRPASVTHASGTGNLWVLNVNGSTLTPTGSTGSAATMRVSASSKGGGQSIANMATLWVVDAPSGGSSSNYALRVDGNTAFGSDGTNYDVEFYGDTSGKNMTWNAGSSGGSLIFNDNALLQLGTGGDIYMYHDGTHNYIEGAAPQSGTYALVTFKSTGGANTYSGITLDTAHATTQAHFRFAINGALKWQWRVPAYDHTGFVAYSWVLGTDVMIMAANGNVGIGTDKSPDYKLDVQGTFRADSTASFGATTNFADYIRPAVNEGSDLGHSSYYWNNLYTMGAYVQDHITFYGANQSFGTPTASWPLKIEADNSDDGQIYAYNDLYLKCADGDMYLLPNGDSWDDVYIGDGGALCRVHLNGTGAYSGLDWMDNGTWKWAAWYHTADSKLYFRRNASPDVDVMAFTDGSNDVVFAGNITAYSDKRLKTNIKTIDSALDKVNQMRGVTYDRIDYPSSGAGVLAQELEEIAPELIDNTNEYKGVSYGNLTAYLVESIKELSDKMDKLENRSFWQRLRNHK